MNDATQPKSFNEIQRDTVDGCKSNLQQVIEDLQKAKGQTITGISFHFRDRSITLRSYLDDENCSSVYGTVADEMIDKIIEKAGGELSVLGAECQRLTEIINQEKS